MAVGVVVPLPNGHQHHLHPVMMKRVTRHRVAAPATMSAQRARALARS